ncbi:hypothetical protein F4703DRAFT_1792659 [Phycomyces blakesleeanus]
MSCCFFFFLLFNGCGGRHYIKRNMSTIVNLRCSLHPIYFVPGLLLRHLRQAYLPFMTKLAVKTMCFIIILVFVILEAFLIKLMVKAWWKQCLFSLIILKRRVLIGKKAVEKTDRQKSKTSEFPFVNV